MDKKTIRKLGVRELEDAYQKLAIESIDQMLDTTAKIHNRRLDLLNEMGEELQKRGFEGMEGIDRLATCSDARVRFCICGTLKSKDLERVVSILTDLVTSSNGLVASLAQSSLATFEAMKRFENS